MGEIDLKIEDLILDHENPRILRAEGQQEALQRIVKDQKTKLVKLAQSIHDHGLNPMDRLLVLRVHQKPERFISLEGNRRVAALMLLTRPSLMTGLDMPAPMKNIFSRLAKTFSKKKVEPIPCFEMSSRQEGDYWLTLRHKGENQGAGIVDWTSLASARFHNRPPEVQALDMVTERGGLPADVRAKITDKFPISTLKRFVEDKQVRKELGLDVQKGKLVTALPGKEAVKGLRKIVVDLATKQKNVRDFIKTDQMLDYVRGFDKENRPDLSKAAAVRAADEIPIVEFPRPSRSSPRRRSDPSERRNVVPRGCRLYVTNSRIADIYKELSDLPLTEARNAIAVLLRVFLELSVDHFLTGNGGKLKKPKPGGGDIYKTLDEKVGEAVKIMVAVGVERDDLAPVIRSLSDKASPLHSDTLHAYVHNRFETPSPTQLTAAWDRAQPLFEKIWAND